MCADNHVGLMYCGPQFNTKKGNFLKNISNIKFLYNLLIH